MLCKRREKPFNGDRFSFGDHLTCVSREKREGGQLLLQECFYPCTSNVEISFSTLDGSRVHNERRIKMADVPETVGVFPDRVA